MSAAPEREWHRRRGRGRWRRRCCGRPPTARPRADRREQGTRHPPVRTLGRHRRATRRGVRGVAVGEVPVLHGDLRPLGRVQAVAGHGAQDVSLRRASDTDPLSTSSVCAPGARMCLLLRPGSVRPTGLLSTAPPPRSTRIMSISKITIAGSGLIDRYRIRYRVADLAPVDPGCVSSRSTPRPRPWISVRSWLGLRRADPDALRAAILCGPGAEPVGCCWKASIWQSAARGPSCSRWKLDSPLAAAEAYLLSPGEDLPEGPRGPVPCAVARGRGCG